MSEKNTSGSPERVAKDLFNHIVQEENKSPRDRDYLLSTYAVCLRTVRNAKYEKE